MTLIKSISGIRGTIGGPCGDTLNPLDIVKFTSAYATFIRQNTPSGSNKIIVGRDARITSHNNFVATRRSVLTDKGGVSRSELNDI